MGGRRVKSPVTEFIVGGFARPGAAALAMFAFYAGIAGLLDIGTSSDALTVLMPDWLTVSLNVVYTLAGTAMFAGMGLKKGNIEAAGWILLAVSVVVRGTAVVTVAGLSVQIAGLLVLYIGFLCAALVRIGQIIRGDTIVVVHVGRVDA